ncbi:MAG: alpha/beta fold hydrolase [Oceanococcaceae bacterium]
MDAPASSVLPPTGHATNEFLDRARRWRKQVDAAVPWLSTTAALAHTGTTLARDVVGIVRGMHGTISSATPPIGVHPEGQTRGITKLVYDCVDMGFAGTESVFSTLAEHLPNDGPMPAQWLPVQAAINGVLGDRLEASGNRLAMTMRRVGGRGTGRHRVMFLHGLCMSEQGFAGSAHRHLTDDLVTRGFSVEYVRYNTGRHISDNGADLDRLLEQLAADRTIDNLSLVGHSMGGLVMRSALAQAESHGHQWPERLRHAVYIGSPHHGAPLERLGNHANRLLKISPYTAPFMRLGNIRSAGIQDLRHGGILPGDWQNRECPDDIRDLRRCPPLAASVRHTLIAATRSMELPTAPAVPLDDYLVPVHSALGICPENRNTLNAPRIDRHTLTGSHHMHLLSGRAVHKLIHAAVTARA